MRIAIDCRALLNRDSGEGAGVPHYAYYFVQSLLQNNEKNEYVLFFDHRFSQEAARAFVGSAQRVEIAYFPFEKYKKFLPFVYSQFVVARAIEKRKPDIVHVLAGGIPLFLKTRTVLTVHDLIIYKRPEWFPRQSISVKFLYPKSIKKAAHIICISQTTKEDVKRIFSKEDKKISVVYPGVTVESGAKDESVLQKKFDQTKPYVLFLGTIEPRKNIGALVRGFVEAWKNSIEIQKTELIIAGKVGWKEKEIMHIIADAAKETCGSVRYLGYVKDEEKTLLLKNAATFAFLSHDEGFGLPILEAMSFGVPTLVSDIQIFHEISKNAALFVDQNKVKLIASALQQILTDAQVREQLREHGFKNMKRFSWTDTVNKTICVYKKLF